MPQCEGVVRPECAASLVSTFVPSFSIPQCVSPFLSFFSAHPAAIFQSNAKERALIWANAANACVFRTVFTLDRGTIVTRAVELASRGIAWHRVASHVWIKRVGTSRDNNLRGGTLTYRRRGTHRVIQWIFQSVSIYRVCVISVCTLLSPILSCTRRIRRKITLPSHAQLYIRLPLNTLSFCHPVKKSFLHDNMRAFVSRV